MMFSIMYYIAVASVMMIGIAAARTNNTNWMNAFHYSRIIIIFIIYVGIANDFHTI